jgi:hypothetical protein
MKRMIDGTKTSSVNYVSNTKHTIINLSSFYMLIMISCCQCPSVTTNNYILKKHRSNNYILKNTGLTIIS